MLSYNIKLELPNTVVVFILCAFVVVFDKIMLCIDTVFSDGGAMVSCKFMGSCVR